MHRRQFTIKRLLIVTAVIASVLALVRLFPPEFRLELAGWWGLLFLCWSAVWAPTRLIDTRNIPNQNSIGDLLLIFGIILFGLALIPFRVM